MGEEAAYNVLRSQSQFSGVSLPCDPGSLQVRVNLIPSKLVFDLFGFCICFETQIEASFFRNGRTSCTLHDAEDGLLGVSMVDGRNFGPGREEFEVDLGDKAQNLVPLN